jgi:hypothetical protein
VLRTVRAVNKAMRIKQSSLTKTILVRLELPLFLCALRRDTAYLNQAYLNSIGGRRYLHKHFIDVVLDVIHFANVVRHTGV